MSYLSTSLSGRVIAPLPTAAPALATTSARSRFRLRRPEAPGTLAALAVGERGVLAGFGAGLDGATTRRLFDLGFAPGASVEVVRRAPLGDPCVFRVADTEIALRRAHAREILLDTLP